MKIPGAITALNQLELKLIESPVIMDSSVPLKLTWNTDVLLDTTLIQLGLQLPLTGPVAIHVPEDLIVLPQRRMP